MCAEHVDFERWQTVIEEHGIQFQLWKLTPTAINSAKINNIIVEGEKILEIQNATKGKESVKQLMHCQSQLDWFIWI